jgi:NADPH-dependent 2,4-dienoyl-CoA reductase/sulfur reductase-like enzyme
MHETVASRMLAAGTTAFRQSVTGQPRGPLCGMGVCYECRVTIDGVPHRRSCQAAPAGSASQIGSTRFDVLIVGAGPAGIAAACAASEGGCRVGVIDDNPAAGGQIWRGDVPARWLDRLGSVALLGGARAVDRPAPGVLLVESDRGAHELRYARLILATGARERFLPFPGWTLPNVMGAGGLQAFVKGGLPIGGKRVVVAGSGPLLLAVASFLRKRGAEVPLVAEQSPWRRLVRLAPPPGKLLQAARLKWGVRYVAGCWPVRAEGDGRIEAVVLSRGGALACDYLACGFGLVPNLELGLLAGCAVRDGFFVVDEWQRTSVEGVYAAGEPTGIGGLDLALAGGAIAGHHAAGRPALARRLFAARARALRFKHRLARAFALRDELKALPAPDTIVCRCEDVTLARIRSQRSWQSAKLQTRCGMGPCQGRVCGPAVEFLLGWRPGSVRPPVYAARASTLALECENS